MEIYNEVVHDLLASEPRAQVRDGKAREGTGREESLACVTVGEKGKRPRVHEEP